VCVRTRPPLPLGVRGCRNAPQQSIQHQYHKNNCENTNRKYVGNAVFGGEVAEGVGYGRVRGGAGEVCKRVGTRHKSVKKGGSMPDTTVSSHTKRHQLPVQVFDDSIEGWGQ